MLKECFGKWRVTVDDDLEKELNRSYPKDVVDRFYRVVQELEEELNEDPHAIERLMREPIIDRELNLRRLRIGKYRAWFIIVYEDCTVVFLGLGTREKFYDRHKKRGL